jgi:hypothetical protein
MTLSCDADSAPLRRNNGCDEDGLHCKPDWQSGRRFARQRNTCPRRVDVCRKQSDEERNQPQRGSPRCRWNDKPDGAYDFKYAGDGDEHGWTREKRGGPCAQGPLAIG